MAENEYSFARKVVVATAVVAAFGIVLLLFWNILDALLLVFAAILLACFLRGLADLLTDKTRLPIGWSLGLVMLIVGLTVGATIWLLAPGVAAQADQLSRRLTSSAQQLTAQVSQYEWGRRLLDQAPTLQQLTNRGNLISRITGIFSTTFGLIADVVLVVFIGIYLAINPGIYVAGLVRLFPKNYRDHIAAVIEEIGRTLRHWLVGRMLLMISNGVLTTLGLWLFQIPLALTLGVVAGLLNFVPNIGPIIAGIPAVLIAWTIGPDEALYVLLLYIFLQNLDGYVFTPLVQQRTVALPPALTIVAQLVFGLLAGSLGVLLATPMTAAGVVLVRRLYLEDVLGERDA
ncbi:MAG TPA: AI-2E family transporter [Chthoniobacterales bacterium]|nr:AI-2E family transporter [Chthoniobacterales bacterium]